MDQITYLDNRKILMTIYIVRGSHANEYELQNYAPLAKSLDIKVITSQEPLTSLSLPTVSLWSPTDLPHFPLRRQLLNRLLGGEQWLLGLKQLVTPSDILHTAETYTPYTHQAVLLRRQNKITKLVCTCWETIPHNNEKLAAMRRWKKQAYQFVDLFHTPTQLAKSALLAEGVPASKITVIPYGVNHTRFQVPGRVHSVKPVVLTLARAVPEKGLKLQQELARRLSDLADFRWVTGVPYDRVPSLYRQADIFLLPSQVTPTWEEQYGMVLLEAMASGLPIVATVSGAIPEVVGNAALLAHPTDLAALEHSLRALLGDHTLWTRYANRSLKRARHLTIRTQSRLLRTLYTTPR